MAESSARRAGNKVTSAAIPVIEIGHLFPNYQPQQLRSSLVMRNPLQVSQKPQVERSVDQSNRSNAPQARKKRATDPSPQAKLLSSPKGVDNQRKWDEMFEQLKVYKEQHGNCNVPKRHENTKLANWVVGQRRVLRKRSHGGLDSSNRISRLNQLGFVWAVRRGPRSSTGAVPPSWEQRLNELKVFRNKHGHCCVPRAYDAALSQWVKGQRHAHKVFMKQKAGEKVRRTMGMTEERIVQLEEIGFAWRVPDRKRSKTPAS